MTKDDKNYRMSSVCTLHPMKSHNVDQVYSRINGVVLKAMKTEALILSVATTANAYSNKYSSTGFPDLDCEYHSQNIEALTNA